MKESQLIINESGHRLGSPTLVSTVPRSSDRLRVENIFTYRDVRLNGWGWLRGRASFVAACTLGTLSNVGVAAYLFEKDAGWKLAALAGITIGAVWNYAKTRGYTLASTEKLNVTGSSLLKTFSR